MENGRFKAKPWTLPQANGVSFSTEPKNNCMKEGRKGWQLRFVDWGLVSQNFFPWCHFLGGGFKDF